MTSAALTKIITAGMTVTALTLFYDEAITAAKSVIQKAKETMVSAEIIQFDKKTVQFWDIYGAPPKNIVRYLKNEFDFTSGRKDFHDYWEEPYFFSSHANGYIILSKGHDKTAGTSDDIYIKRTGFKVKSRLKWRKGPKEMVDPMKQIAIKQQKHLTRKNQK